MKRRDASRVLTFAVTGALLGGVGIGGCKYRGPYTNPGPSLQPPGGTEPDGSEPEPEPPENVNEGPVDEPAEVTPTNTGPQPELMPEPPKVEGTNNIRKVEDEPPPEPVKPAPKYVNTRKVEDEPPRAKK